jgi:hypothetical protein
VHGDWALGIEARSRALTSEDEAAERRYREAIDRLGRTSIRIELARAHLVYGEWLRREKRRTDAREQLRIAHEMFAAIGMEAFAERAARELTACGETIGRRTVESRDQLTAQESQIARLARDGLSNPEIGAPARNGARRAPRRISRGSLSGTRRDDQDQERRGGDGRAVVRRARVLVGQCVIREARQGLPEDAARTGRGPTTSIRAATSRRSSTSSARPISRRSARTSTRRCGRPAWPRGTPPPHGSSAGARRSRSATIPRRSRAGHGDLSFLGDTQAGLPWTTQMVMGIMVRFLGRQLER